MASQENESESKSNVCFSCQIPFYIESGTLTDITDQCGDDCGLCKKCCPRTKQCGCGCFYDTHNDADKSKCNDDCTEIPSCGWCGKDCLPFKCLCTECNERLLTFYYRKKNEKTK